MLRNRIYYHCKRYMPWGLRMAIRQWLARRQRARFSSIWPISEDAGRKPEGWPGWPNGKKFAFVITHDVEGECGLEKSRALMQLEIQEGFRSSFNFVPEGEYAVSSAFREELASYHFEVGVHDLHHDGKLFWNRRKFIAKAQRINHYLREWDAGGFRAGFMHHNLDWLRDLDIVYDASTFDTDPFEPQPDGVSTIFPFCVPRGPQDCNGFIELPYTMPQDSTLFFVLGENSASIWKRKLDWIAMRGGMALMVVHPDYVSFGRGHGSKAEYPITLFTEILHYVTDNYAAESWCALPKEVASYVQSLGAGRPNVLKPGTLIES